MPNKVQKAIDNSKRKRDFKHRQKRRSDTSKKRRGQDEDKYVQRKRFKKDDQNEPKKKVEQDEDLEEMIGEEDKELEEELARDQDLGEEIDLDEDEFQKYGDELNIPSEEEDEEEDEFEKDVKGDETDSDLEDYYKELGIQDEEDLTKPKKGKVEDEVKYKTKKRKASQEKEKTVEQTREKLLDTIIGKARDAPTYSSITRVIKIVKQVFSSTKQDGEDEEEEQDQKKKKSKKAKAKPKFNIAAVLSSEQYKKLLEFFTQELPTIILKSCSVSLKVPKTSGTSKGDKNQKTYDLKKSYGHLSTKQQMLLRTYSANYTRLLGQTLDEESSSSYIAEFLVNSTEVAQCCMPFGLYKKKLAGSCARIVAQYSKMQEET